MRLKVLAAFVFATSLGGVCRVLLAQNFVEPTVTLDATDAHAGEAGLDTGTFTVRRTGPTNFPLAVFYQLSGTASNGVDYEELDVSVQIPEGALIASFTVRPIDDLLIERPETVAAQLVGSPLDCATCGYDIGVPSNAVVVIADNDGPVETNQPPRVEITAPVDGTVFPASADIWIAAQAFDFDGYVATVEFFEGANSLGVTTNNPLILGPLNPFMITWSNVPAGHYELTARATDDKGATALSPVVHVWAVETNPVQQAEVNIYALDDVGSEIPVVPPWLGMVQRSDPFVFAVTRTGPTNSSLTVFYSIGGTASEGVDYSLYPISRSDQDHHGRVAIPAGASSAKIEGWVIDDFAVEGTETVELTLEPPACIQVFPPPPDCYLVGPNDRALARILDNDVTAPPVVTILATDSEASEAGPDLGRFTISRTGDASDPLVIYFAIRGTAEIGVDYLSFSNLVAFYSVFTGLPAVEIPAGARAVDLVVSPLDDPLTEGRETVVLELLSQPWAPYLVGSPSHAVVTIADDEAGETNHAPFVQLNAPENGDMFMAPAEIELRAYAQDAEDGYELNVEFFEGTNSLGFGTFVATACPPPYCPFYALDWSNVPPGEYVVRAKAIDSQGATSFSHAVRISVTGTNFPPGTNLPVVTIVAADAIAVEGPFCRSNWWWTSSWDGGDWTIVPSSGDPSSLDWRTNHCSGTNTATFVVRRSGPTNAELTVYYAIGGTASNGVDDVALPGRVTISAGHRSARIAVIPIEDLLPEHIETVLLGLRPPPALVDDTATYVIGFPSRAAALILDNDRPRPPCLRLPDGMFHVCRPATNGHSFTVRGSTDLVNWTVLCTNTVTDGAVHYVDPDAPHFKTRFYQVVPEPFYVPQD